MLDFMTEIEKSKVLLMAEEISHYDKNSKLHPLIEKHKEAVKIWNKNGRSIEGKNMTAAYFSGWVHMDEYNPDRLNKFLAGVVSNASLDRACRILDALFKSLEKLGCIINPDMTVKIGNKIVLLELYEKQSSIPHVLTKKEIKELEAYNANENKNQSKKPFVRKLDHHFNGELCISARKYKYYSDSEEIKIEDKLGRILIGLFEESNRLRIIREEKEEKERIIREEQLRKELLFEQKRKESKKIALEERKVRALQNIANDWDMANKIRSFVHQVELEDTNNEKTEWIQWAKKKADWLDPTVGRKDEILGIRHALNSHGKYTAKRRISFLGLKQRN